MIDVAAYVQTSSEIGAADDPQRILDVAPQRREPLDHEVAGWVVLRDGLAGDRRVRLDDAFPPGVRDGGARQMPEELHALRHLPLPQDLEVLGVPVLQDRDQELFLGTEVVEYAGVRHPDLLGDGDQGPLLVALGAESLRGRSDDLLSSLRRGLAFSPGPESRRSALLHGGHLTVIGEDPPQPLIDQSYR